MGTISCRELRESIYPVYKRFTSIHFALYLCRYALCLVSFFMSRPEKSLKLLSLLKTLLSSQLVVNPLLKGFNHEARDLVGYRSAERGIKRVYELVFDSEFNLS